MDKSRRNFMKSAAVVSGVAISPSIVAKSISPPSMRGLYLTEKGLIAIDDYNDIAFALFTNGNMYAKGDLTTTRIMGDRISTDKISSNRSHP